MGSGERRLLVLHRHAGESRQFRFVRDKQVNIAENLVGKRTIGSRIQNHFHPGLVGDFRRPHHRRKRNFQLEQQNGRRADLLRDGIDFRLGDIGIRTGSHRDAVLPFRIDIDQGDARRQVAAQHTAHIQAFFLIMFHRIVSENILAHLADQLGVTAQPGGCNRLIGALSAGSHIEQSVRHRLARDGQHGRLDGHVRIAASENKNLFAIHLVAIS